MHASLFKQNWILSRQNVTHGNMKTKTKICHKSETKSLFPNDNEQEIPISGESVIHCLQKLQ